LIVRKEADYIAKRTSIKERMEKGEIVGALKKDLKMLIKQLDGLFQALHEGAQILSDEAKEAIDLSIGDCYEKLRHRVPN